MAVPEGKFRRVLGHLAAGVTIVTSRDADARPSGLTATAVCSVSLDPPLVLVCVDANANTLKVVRESRVYALNFLAAGARELADRFASAASDKFDGVAFEAGETGSPRLASAIAWCECLLEEAIAQGDHVILVGRVLEAGLGDGDTEPLLHFRGRYRTLARPEA